MADDAKEKDGSVACKRCGKPIQIANPSQVLDEFSVECGNRDTRKIYTRV
jgi:hypothetical protein